MKNALVTTYCTWTSYGSALQAYALQQFLKNIEVDSYIVSDSLDLEYDESKRKIVGLKKIVKDFFDIFQRSKIHRRYIRNTEFIEKNISIRRFSSVEDIRKTVFDAEVCIAGSDQIFHPDLCSPLFFLDCFPSDKKKVSYAASMGITKVKREKEGEFERLLNNFDCISVREADNVDVIKRYFDRDVRVNIDPTFLISPSDWRKISREYGIKKKYILVYPIYWDLSYNRLLKELKKKTGYTIVTVKSGFNRVYGDKHIIDAGTDEFIWLIDHAEAVVTSSFHGVAMSAIFNKNFAAVVNPGSPSRIESLLNTLNLSPLPIEQLCDEHMDYSFANEIIAKEKLRTEQYFKEVFSHE